MEDLEVAVESGLSTSQQLTLTAHRVNVLCYAGAALDGGSKAVILSEQHGRGCIWNTGRGCIWNTVSSAHKESGRELGWVSMGRSELSP